MAKNLDELYAVCPPLRPEYISQILKLSGDTAEKVSRITGGIHRDEVELVTRVVAEINPAISLEIGLGYGFSAMAICQASERQAPERRHIIIDPYQSSHWNNGGMKHLVEAGFGDIVELREELSYRALPQLEYEGVRVDLAFIDGWHTFDFAFVDFFYIDKLLREGGVVIFDDADWPSIRPVIRYAITNLSYSLVATLPEKKAREPFDISLGIEGSCIALRKNALVQPREIFFHQSFY